MASITYIPKRVIDINGIADGASIYVYQTGTTTPVSLFSDSGFGTPVSNPYVVATGAYVPTLYTNYTGGLRLRVVSSSGDITDEDPYLPIVTQFSELSIHSGNALKVYEGAGTGVATVIQSASGLGGITSYNYGTAAYQPLKVDGSSLSFRIGGVEKGKFDGTSFILTDGQPLVMGSAVTVVNGAGILQAAAIAASSITYAKIQNVTNARLLGNNSGAGAAPSEISVTGGLAFSGSTLTISGAISNTSVTASGDITASGTSSNIGYVTGAGGTVTQTSSRTTGVSLNRPSGQITLFSEAGSTSWQTFTVNNTTVTANDVVIVNQKSGIDDYMMHVTRVATNAFDITFATTGGTTTEQPVFTFAVISGATT